MANRKIAYTLGRGRAYIFDMFSTSGYMGEKYFQEFGPRFFDMFLESPGTGGTSIRLSLHETNETYPHGLGHLSSCVLGFGSPKNVSKAVRVL